MDLTPVLLMLSGGVKRSHRSATLFSDCHSIAFQISQLDGTVIECDVAGSRGIPEFV